MRTFLATVSFALALVVVTSPADAKRHTIKSADSTLEIVKLKRELASARSDIRNVLDLLRSQPSTTVAAFASAPVPFLDVKPPVVLAALNPSDVKAEIPGVKEITLRGVSTVRLPDPLKDVLLKVQAVCGSSVISACRPGARVRGSGRVSLHASCRAADITMKNYSCAYPILAKTPCGYSTDPGRVRHIHVSCSKGTGEYGRKFAHWNPHRQVHRYARRHGHRLARV